MSRPIWRLSRKNSLHRQEEIEATAVSIQELADIVSENSADVQKDSKEMESTAETLKKHISRFTI